MAKAKEIIRDDETDAVFSDDDILPETENLAADTLRGDMRDTVLGWVKAQQKPWQQMDEMEQRGLAGAIDAGCRDLISRAVSIIAANGRKCIVSTLEQYTEKDGLKITLKAFGKGETVAALHEACGREVLLIATGAEEFMGGEPAEIDANQRALFDETPMGEAAE